MTQQTSNYRPDPAEWVWYDEIEIFPGIDDMDYLLDVTDAEIAASDSAVQGNGGRS